ncbi:prephenate dehydrogenase [Streptomyces triticagri]|uniref:Prephenate dehydrogenase n=1 Tax=Streptomyces triticagri TaxID=2293568 RepID=A0A372M767_9ACTN|nr:prephenate dehydrogenase/arogenate dehydrogenase family protein [Streptomyces triticagri]RFU86784.1 prephenate dehydrogenase [Streptomyces triticagri]
MTGRWLVVGGMGAVGALFIRRLVEDGHDVCVVDPAVPEGYSDRPVRWLRGDVLAPDDRLTAELRSADAVLLAVPEPVAVAAVPVVAELLRPDALLVDTLSVKQHIADTIRKHAPDVQAVGLNPMFAPSLGFEGRPVAAVVVHDGPQVPELYELVDSWGARIVPLDDARHDRLTAAVQALTHASVLSFGLALDRLDPGAGELRELGPPPYTTLAALLARVSSGTTEVYWDVQSANPQAAAARAALADAARRFADAVEYGTEADFAAVMAAARGALGPELEHYSGIAERIFTSR